MSQERRQKIPETECQRHVLAMLAKAGIFAWRNNSGLMRAGKRFIRFGKVGSGDIIGILPGGRFLSIEIKSNGEPVTDRQREFMELINANGGHAFVATSVEDAACKLGLE